MALISLLLFGSSQSLNLLLLLKEAYAIQSNLVSLLLFGSVFVFSIPLLLYPQDEPYFS